MRQLARTAFFLALPSLLTPTTHAQIARLSRPFSEGAIGGQVRSFVVAADEDRVIYDAARSSYDGPPPEEEGVFSVPLTGGTPTRLSLPNTSEDTSQVVLYGTCDGRVIWSEGSFPARYYSAPIAGGEPPTPIVQTTTASNRFAALSPATGRLVFYQSLEQDAPFRLYSIAIDGTGLAELENESAPPLQNPSVPFRLSEDGRRVGFRAADGGAFVAPVEPDRGAVRVSAELSMFGLPRFVNGDQEVVFLEVDRSRLYAAPTDASAPPRALTPELHGEVMISPFVVDPSGNRVAFSANLDDPGRSEVYVVEVASGDRVKVSGNLPPGATTFGSDLTFGLDGSMLYFRADIETDDRVEFYGVPVDASAPPQRINPDLPDDIISGPLILGPNGTVVSTGSDGTLWAGGLDVEPVILTTLLDDSLGSDALVTPDGQTVIYRDLDGRGIGLLSIDIAGGRPERLIEPGIDGADLVSGLELTPDGSGVLLRGDLRIDGWPNLFMLTLDGSRPLIQLNGPLPVDPGGDVQSLHLSPDGQGVAYTTKPFSTLVTDEVLYVPRDRSQHARTLTQTFGDITNILSPRVSYTPDGSHLLFVGTQGDTSPQLFAAPLDRARRPVPVGPGKGALIDYLPLEDSRHVVVRVLGEAGQELWIAPIDRPGEARLLATSTIDIRYESALDGARIVYVRGPFGAPRLESISTLVQEDSVVLADTFGDYALEPTGSRVIYEVLEEDEPLRVYSRDVSGAPSQLLFEGTVSGYVSGFWFSSSNVAAVSGNLDSFSAPNIYLFDTAVPSPPVQILEINVGVNAPRVLFSPDASHVAIVDSTRRLWAAPADGTQAQPLFGFFGSAFLETFSSTGELYYLFQGVGPLGFIPEVYRADLEKGIVTALTPPGGPDVDAFAIDETSGTLVYREQILSPSFPPRGRLYTVPLEGGDPTLVGDPESMAKDFLVADGQLLFIGDQRTRGVFELFVTALTEEAPVLTGPRRKLSGSSLR